MAFGKILKVGAVALGAAGGVAGVVDTVVDIVEQHNYEYQHVINETHTYLINGEYVTEEEFNNYLNGTAATKLYYGAVDDVDNFALTDLTEVNFVGEMQYTFHVDAGDEDKYENEIAPTYGLQYVTVVLPDQFTLTSFAGAENKQVYSFESTSITDYTVYYLSSPVYNVNSGGENYTIFFK